MLLYEKPVLHTLVNSGSKLICFKHLIFLFQETKTLKHDNKRQKKYLKSMLINWMIGKEDILQITFVLYLYLILNARYKNEFCHFYAYQTIKRATKLIESQVCPDAPEGKQTTLLWISLPAIKKPLFCRFFFPSFAFQTGLLIFSKFVV